MNNEISVSKCNITTHWYHSGTTSWHPIQRLWVSISVTLWNSSVSCQNTLDFCSQNFIFAKLECDNFLCRLVCSSWDSICEPSWSQIDVSTTCRYCDDTVTVCNEKWTWVTYISNILSNKLILFNILDFWSTRNNFFSSLSAQGWNNPRPCRPTFWHKLAQVE